MRSGKPVPVRLQLIISLVIPEGVVLVRSFLMLPVIIVSPDHRIVGVSLRLAVHRLLQWQYPATYCKRTVEAFSTCRFDFREASVCVCYSVIRSPADPSIGNPVFADETQVCITL